MSLRSSEDQRAMFGCRMCLFGDPESGWQIMSGACFFIGIICGAVLMMALQDFRFAIFEDRKEQQTLKRECERYHRNAEKLNRR